MDVSTNGFFDDISVKLGTTELDIVKNLKKIIIMFLCFGLNCSKFFEKCGNKYMYRAIP